MKEIDLNTILSDIVPILIGIMITFLLIGIDRGYDYKYKWMVTLVAISATLTILTAIHTIININY